MKNVIELFENGIEEWRINKGIGTAIIPKTLNDKSLLLGILQKVYNKTPNITTVIVISHFSERQKLIEYLTNQEDKSNNEEFNRLIKEKYIKIFTDDFIAKTKPYNPSLCICYQIKELKKEVEILLKASQFKLIVLNNLLKSTIDMNTIYSIASPLNTFKQSTLDVVRGETPVEEMRIGVSIPDDTEEYKLLNFYNDYITTSINMFGSFDTLKLARTGDSRSNISATQFCAMISKENGWHSKLDMNNPFDQEIDKVYNPASIRERSELTYEYIRKRLSLLSDYDGKLNEILKIVNDNKDKKILIISKRAEFAKKITDYLNQMSETEICGDYHDKVEPIPATTLDGTPIYVKSGKHEGERKYIAAKAQKSYNETRFNHNLIRVLSANNAPDKDLNISVDIVIITSSMCEDIKSYLYRLNKLRITGEKLFLYQIYTLNSIEDKRLQNKPIGENHSIKNDEENDIFSEFFIGM